MMRFSTGVFVGLLTLLALLLFSGCGNDKFVGKWEAYEVSAMGQTVQASPGDSTTFDITKEGGDYYLSDSKSKAKEKASFENGKLVFREKNTRGGEMVSTLSVDKQGILLVDMSNQGLTMSIRCRKAKTK